MTTVEKPNETGVVVALTTFPDMATARQIAAELVSRQCVACVNLLGEATSIYRWKGEIEMESEIPAILKTGEETVPALWEALRELHPYDEPEFVVLPVTGGSEGYLDWVRSSLGS